VSVLGRACSGLSENGKLTISVVHKVLDLTLEITHRKSHSEFTFKHRKTLSIIARELPVNTRGREPRYETLDQVKAGTHCALYALSESSFAWLAFIPLQLCFPLKS